MANATVSPTATAHGAKPGDPRTKQPLKAAAPKHAAQVKAAVPALAKSASVKVGRKELPAKALERPYKATTATNQEKAVKVVKADHAKKPKLVRDSFTIPKAEYQVLEVLKQRALQLAQPAKKSELLRAGIKALAALSDDDFRAALSAVPAIKTGRPAGSPPEGQTVAAFSATKPR
ncbi:MAG: hypothetical protein JWQ88_3184 [Rhodoferax sp.]|nr:hypothetical protein [Rhodoferax sp.]